MKIEAQRRFKQAVASVALLCMVMQPTYALNLATQPLFIANSAPPKVMLTISKDQQLYKKAYNDYSDLDGDGVPETTYKHSIRYYGYFDSVKCYTFNSTLNRFEPQSVITDGTGTPVNAYCSGQWSGNFLNWLSMSRMDAVRKLLYGGTRIVDTASETVLDRAFIPTDAHAWAKYYDGTDINQLTPFADVRAKGNYRFRAEQTNSNFTIPNPAPSVDIDVDFKNVIDYVALGDQVKIAKSATEYFIGAIMATSNAGKTLTLRVNTAGVGSAGVKSNNWTVTNLSSTGISFCNLTPGVTVAGNPSSKSQTSVFQPRFYVARGDFALWSANESRQCQWFEDFNNLQLGFGGVRSNGNQTSLSEIEASAENPSRAVHGLGTGLNGAIGEFSARVLVCSANAALRGTEKCKVYPNGNFKPIGLLQTYGDTEQIHFGLLTGSYAKNISGGVLRKNVGAFTDEVNLSTDGTFTNTVGIAKTLDRMRIYGYNYPNGTYLPPDGDNCTYQLTSITENSCTSWGNPMSEIYFEAIRYFAAKTDNQATPAYTYGAGSKDAELNLPLATWKAPLNQSNVCTRLNVLVFNASVSSNDDDLRGRTATDINSTSTIKQLTDVVGAAEGINGKNFFIGKLVTDGSSSPGFELCTAKTISTLGDVSGICPEGPTLGGSFLLSGVAYQAHTQRIRTDLDPKNNTDALKVTSYGIQLATNTPQLLIPVPGKPGQQVIIQPTYRLDLGSGNFGGGALVDMKFVRQQVSGTQTIGKVYINWEDSEQGGDYDQDMWGTLEWTLDTATNSLTITTNAISASTSNPQGFGYTVSGTTKDGVHFHSGILGFNFTDTVVAQPANTAGCSNCQLVSAGAGQRGPQTATYTLSAAASSANALNDPLWYVAKYGGFDDKNHNSALDAGEWDNENHLTGLAAPDGVPDNYFLVTNPLMLETSLNAALQKISAKGSASSVASNSTSLNSNSAVYTARFSAGDWTGGFLAFPIDTHGVISTNASWDASNMLPAPDSRVVLTYLNTATARQGVPFRWPADPLHLNATDIGQDLIDDLNTSPYDSVTKDGLGAARLQFLRGDASREGSTSPLFRTRTTKLGDIVNSNPVFVGAVPDDVNLDASYKVFRTPFLTSPRTPMVYVAANDGMLHGFDASVPGGGTERVAYVPSKTFTGLNQLTKQNYVHRYYVDGSPAVSDAELATGWKTVLVGALGAGGRGVYALDVTNPPPAPGAGASTAAELAASSKVLWEFNVDDDLPPVSANPADPQPFGLGYVLGQPVIRKMANGRWAAIVSGGYNTTEVVPGKAKGGDKKGYVYIIFLDGPKGNSGRTWQWGIDYIRLDTGTPAAADPPNSVAEPFAADVNADGKVDFIYAGDLLGTFWKFDVSNANASLWSDSTNRVALFKGGPTQPITTAAQGTLHPTGKGFILNFGTGKYLEPSDPVAAPTAPFFATQSFYGIWDKNDKTPVSGQTVVTAKSQLFQQTINEAAVNGTVFRYITGAGGAKGPDWATQLGWFMDFPNSAATGERDVFDPIIVSRRLIFTTVIPSGGACEFGGTGPLMVLNPSTGGAFDAPVLDVNNDGLLNNLDTVVGGFFASGVVLSGITMTPTVLTGGLAPGQTAISDSTLLYDNGIGRVRGGGNRRNTMIASGASGVLLNLVLGASPDSGRATWREVIKK